MAGLKTKQTDVNVEAFIRSFANTEQKIQDSFALVKLMQKVTGCPPKMWGASIIGFGKYHYKSERSRQEGDWLLIGFSPRKTAISLYVYSGGPEQERLLSELGKFKMGKACIYVKKLEDIDQVVLTKLMNITIDSIHAKWGKMEA